MSDTRISGPTEVGFTMTGADEAEWPLVEAHGPGPEEQDGEQGDEPAVGLDDLPWQLSYDRASVNRFVAEVEAERARLHEAIEAARARVQQAQAAATARQVEASEELGALVLAAQRELEEMERHHRLVLDAIAAAAEKEVARLLARAGEEAAAVRATIHSLTARMSTGTTFTPPSVDLELDALAAQRMGNGSDDR